MNTKLPQYSLLLLTKNKYKEEDLTVYWTSDYILNLVNVYKSLMKNSPEKILGYYILDIYNNNIVEYHKN